MIKYIAYHDSVMSGIVPFGGRVLQWAKFVHRRQKVLGGIAAHALAYGKSVGFLVVRKIREP